MPRARGRGRRLLLRLGVLALLLLALVFAYQAARTALALREAKNDAIALQGEVRRHDVAAVKQTLRKIESASATARRHSDNTLWDVLGRVPFLGDDLEAVQVMAKALNEASSQGYEPAVDLLDRTSGEQLRDADGRVRLDAVAALEDPLSRLASALRVADEEVDALDTDQLLGPLRNATISVRDQLGDTLAAAEGGVRMTRLLPPMLGADGPRRYLMVVQNNAETRATGGLPGSFVVLDAVDGKVTVGAQRSVDDFDVLTSPVLPLTSEERALYGDNLGENIRDTNLTPDFPRAASLMDALYTRSFGTEVDGVISVDPVALAAVLRATGPVQVGEETFTAGNVVRTLLNDVYQRFETREEQDAYFDTVARGIFGALVTRDVDPAKLLRQLGRAAEQRRFLVWSADAAEQREIAGSVVSGELPRDTGAQPHVGLYLNDGTAAKIEYYLDYVASLRSSRCTPKGAQTLQVGMVLESSVPRRGYQLSRWVRGNGQYAPIGFMRLNLRMYAPTGGELTRLTANGKQVRVQTTEHNGRQVAVVTMLVRAHQEVRLQAEFRTRDGQTGDPVLDWTPGVRTKTSTVTTSSSCR